MAGYPHGERISTGVHDPLFASALCLENGSEAALLISLDLLKVGNDWGKQCRAAVSARTGIPAGHILLGATHTHSGPGTQKIPAWLTGPVGPPFDPGYVDFAVGRVVEAAVGAWETRRPAAAAWTTANVRGIAGSNRIAADGPEDPEAGLLFVRSREDFSPFAILSVYGMHPTVLHEDSKLVSSDFIAYTRGHLEQTFPGAGVVYLNGVCGNQSPRRVVKAQTFAEAERIGVTLGQKMASSLKVLRDFCSDIPLAGASATLDLKGRTFPPVDAAETNLEAARRHYGELRRIGALHPREQRPV